MTQPYDGAGTYEPGRLGDDAPSTAEHAKQQAAGLAGEAKAQAGGVAGDAKEQGRRVAEHAKGEALDVAEHAKMEARGLLGQAQGELSSQAGTQQQRLADLLRTLSEELGGILDPQNSDYRQGMVTDLAQQASSRISTATSWLENREPRDVLDEVSRFARRRPGAFLALAAGAGLLVGRLSRGMADDARDSGTPERLGSGYETDYGTGYAAGYGAPVPPVTRGTAYGRQGYVNDTESLYAAESEVVAPTYDDATGLDTPAADTSRFPTLPEAEQTYTPQAGTTTLGEDRR